MVSFQSATRQGLGLFFRYTIGITPVLEAEREQIRYCLDKIHNGWTALTKPAE